MNVSFGRKIKEMLDFNNFLIPNIPRWNDVRHTFPQPDAKYRKLQDRRFICEVLQTQIRTNGSDESWST